MPCGCTCLFALIASAAPRLGLLFLWLFTPYVGRAFTGFLLPLLGLIFLPITTIVYVLLYTPGAGMTAWGWVLMIFGFLLDLGSYAGNAQAYRNRQQR